MIPQAYITEWSHRVPWQTNEQVEQDLIISRALVAIFSDELLAKSLAFRGGTALHKLFLPQPLRYSENIDLVQMNEGPFGVIIDRLRDRLDFLGEPRRKQKEHNNTLVYSFESEFPPAIVLKLKVETNCREHFSVLPYREFLYEIKSTWFEGTCQITTYQLEELIGTKLRALYQRKKGRDLFDIYAALTMIPDLKRENILLCYRKYMDFAVGRKAPSGKLFLQNMEAKMNDTEFTGDIVALIRPTQHFSLKEAYDLVRTELINRL